MKLFFDILIKSISMPIDRDFNFKIKFFKIFFKHKPPQIKTVKKISIKHIV